MSLFHFSKPSFGPITDSKNIVDRYQRLRQVCMRLNSLLVRRLSPDVLDEGGRKLGILRDGMFVFDNEDQSSVLMDYCIYDVRRKGRNAVEQYLCDSPPEPDSDEMACLRAMQHAIYALAVVLHIEPGVGCHIRNLWTDKTHLLIDIGFSKSARPGTLMATRLLDFGNYVTTSGAALPMGFLDDTASDEWQRKIRAGVPDDRADPAPLIRRCLQQGASSHVRYETPHINRRPDVGEDAALGGTSTKRRRELSKRHASKPAGNRRCRCGSGKMFKNCCGKHLGSHRT
jgi:hypothetical protein